MKKWIKKILPLFLLSFLIGFLSAKVGLAEVFIQGGGVGGFPFGDPAFSELNPGPGAFAALGFKGNTFGVRGEFLWINFPADTASGSDLLGGGVDFMVYSPRFAAEVIQLYLALGGGFYVLTGSADLGGFGFNVGAGVDLKLTDHISLGIENNFRPIINLFGEFSTFDDDILYIYTLMGILTFHF